MITVSIELVSLPVGQGMARTRMDGDAVRVQVDPARVPRGHFYFVLSYEMQHVARHVYDRLPEDPYRARAVPVEVVSLT